MRNTLWVAAGIVSGYVTGGMVGYAGPMLMGAPRGEAGQVSVVTALMGAALGAWWMVHLLRKRKASPPTTAV